MQTPTTRPTMKRVSITFFALLLGLAAARGQIEDCLTNINLNYLGYRDGLLFWKADCSIPPAPSQIVQQPSGGGAQNLVYAPGGCAPAVALKTEVALGGDGFHYWLNAAGEVQKVRPGGVPQTIATTPSPSTLYENTQVAVSPNYVFWAQEYGEFMNSFKVYRVRKTGDLAPELVLDLSAVNVGRLLEMITYGDTNVTLLTYDGPLIQMRLEFLPFPPRWEWVRTDIASLASAMTVRGDRLYWVEAAPDHRTSTFLSAPVTAPGLSVPHHAVTSPSPFRIDQLAVDGVNLYYQQVVSGNASLYRKPLVLGTAEEIAGPLGYFATYMVTDGRYVFWQKDAHTISRFAVGAAAIRRDIEAAGMEVVQAIQNTNNNAPLIMGKPTIVRLFGRLAFSSDGATQISLSPEALLYGEKSGVRLPGSPLSPVPPAPGRRRPIAASAGARTNLNDGWTFELPDAWTRQGAITLRGVFNPNRGVREINYLNNTNVVTANFERRSPICVQVIPLWHRLGTAGGSYDPALEPMWDRTESLLPASELRVYFPGGPPMAELEACWDLPPWCDGPYELRLGDSVDSTLESWAILAKLALRNIGTDASCACQNDNGRTHTAALFNASDDRAFNGMSAFSSVISMINLHPAPGDVGGINNIYSGVTFAHELGHNYGRCHVVCPTSGPGMPGATDGCSDGGYPYPPCMIAANDDDYIGYDPISRNLIPFDQAGDLMSYAQNLSPGKARWPSDYTWRALRNQFNTMAGGGGSPSDPAIAAGGTGPDTWLVSGMVDTSTGEAQMLYSVKLDAAAAARATEMAASGDCGAYLVVAYDVNGVAISQGMACLGETRDGNANQHVFLALLSGIDQAARLELAPANDPGKPLTTMLAGPNPPTVSILKPGNGDVIDTRLRVEWNGEDPDDDPLRYTVRYSRDDGANWQVIVDQTPRLAVEFDTPGLPGGAACRVQVIASDGIHTAEAISEVFTVKGKLPRASISFETLRGRSGPLAHAFVGAGEPVVVRGKAYDDEDGPLPGSAFAWTVQPPTYPWPFFSSGPRLDMRGFPPGDYLIALQATDSDTNTATAFATLTIDPKYIPDFSEVIELDGYGDDLGYLDDRTPLELRYAGGDVATARMVRSGDRLYVCVSGLALGANPRQFVAVCADTDHSGGTLPQANDLRFQVYADGEVKTLRGDGATFVEDPVPVGLQARVSTGEQSWTAELAIDLARLGGWNGQTNGISIGHYHRNYSGDDTLWPLGGVWDSPGTWGACVFGPNPGDLADSDGDGLPDGWEMAHFGNLKRDGTGDCDGDGMIDSAEWVAGDNPASALSRLAVRIEPEPAGGYRLRWTSAPGRSYTIYRSTDLQTFVAVATAIPSGGAETSWVDRMATPGQAFYRVQVQYWR